MALSATRPSDLTRRRWPASSRPRRAGRDDHRRSPGGSDDRSVSPYAARWSKDVVLPHELRAAYSASPPEGSQAQLRGRAGQDGRAARSLANGAEAARRPRRTVAAPSCRRCRQLQVELRSRRGGSHPGTISAPAPRRRPGRCSKRRSAGLGPARFPAPPCSIASKVPWDSPLPKPSGPCRSNELVEHSDDDPYRRVKDLCRR